MSNLKILRHRIRSVQSTRKITTAMKLIATAHFKKLQKRHAAGIDYASGLYASLRAAVTEKNFEEDLPPLLRPSSGVRPLVLVMGSDRGLCGGFNLGVAKYLKQQQKQWSKDLHFICIGKKTPPLLAENKDKILKVFPMSDQGSYHKVLGLAYFLENEIALGHFDSCLIVYNRFGSVLSRVPTVHSLIPFEEPLIVKKEPSYDFGFLRKPLFGVEPVVGDVLRKLAFKNMVAQLYLACLESQLSEESARMMEMDQSTRNAHDMLEKLELTYHRSRQSIITGELIEIIAGAESLQGV